MLSQSRAVEHPGPPMQFPKLLDARDQRAGPVRLNRQVRPIGPNRTGGEGLAWNRPIRSRRAAQRSLAVQGPELIDFNMVRARPGRPSLTRLALRLSSGTVIPNEETAAGHLDEGNLPEPAIPSASGPLPREPVAIPPGEPLLPALWLPVPSDQPGGFGGGRVRHHQRVRHFPRRPAVRYPRLRWRAAAQAASRVL